EGIIARIYESMRKRGKTKLECLLPLEAVWITDLLEKNVELVEHDGTGFELWFNPFQIITLRLVPASP
ncbi:MAG TPA: glycosyl hydrolase-related protein, partial [candidate division Zixibacteria bacterium]|nr:glycosyl hydrolase-related protein [candidate division Zixibacteria bacterium]